MFKDREGKPLNRLAELSKKTAKHAGVPRGCGTYYFCIY